MSETGPSSIVTSTSRISERPTKKRALDPVSQQSAQVAALFKNPDREITLESHKPSRNAALPPEIVANVQGSSAGAGSGEFHVYKASRRREYERLRLMDEEVEREKADQGFAERKEELKSKDEERLEKNRAKREKAKARASKKAKGVADGGVEKDGGGIAEPESKKKKLGAVKVAVPVGGLHRDDRANGGEADNDGQATTQEEVGIMIHDDD